MSDVFEKRLHRAATLEKEWPFASEILSFLKELFPSQRVLYHHIAAKAPTSFEPSILLPLLPPVMNRIEQASPEAYRGMIQAWRQLDEGQRRNLLILQWTATDKDLFKFPKILIQPFACWLVEHGRLAAKPAESPSRICPFCGHGPGVAVLREDKGADTVRRTLICSLCSLEWDFPRVLCPNCNEEKPEKLPRYTAQEIPWMRVEACDSCGKYLKSVDLTLNWDAEPVVDELASTPLDVIAHEHGYTKITPNLAGL